MYKLKDLKVVKYNINEYYMCEYKDDCYTELFTKKVLDTNNISEVESLSDYYSIIDILSGSYKGTLESLFWKYFAIVRHKVLLDYDKDNNQNISCLDRDDNVKMYSLDKYCYIEVERNVGRSKYSKNYICKYNTVTNQFIEFFTHEKINSKYVKSITPICNNDICNKYMNYASSKKVSAFNLLKIYNELNKLDIINNYTEDDIVEELKNKGVYEESKMYKKIINNH